MCVFDSHGDPTKSKQAHPMVNAHVVLPDAVKVDGVLVPGFGGVVSYFTGIKPLPIRLILRFLRVISVGRLSLGGWLVSSCEMGLSSKVLLVYLFRVMG